MADTRQIADAFVALADTLTEDYDLIEFLHSLSERAVDLLGVTEAGVVLADRRKHLRPLASSSERMRHLELIEVQSQDGPCLDAWHTKAPVRSDDLSVDRQRWPTFAPAALDAGLHSAYALPMRLRSECIGALNLFADRADALSAEDQILGQAMADVATIGILNERIGRHQDLVSEQLEAALHRRVVLEQAKGVIAELHGCDVDQAFTVIATTHADSASTSTRSPSPSSAENWTSPSPLAGLTLPDGARGGWRRPDLPFAPQKRCGGSSIDRVTCRSGPLHTHERRARRPSSPDST